jgi:molybdate transport system substrate-binding protein
MTGMRKVLPLLAVAAVALAGCGGSSSGSSAGASVGSSSTGASGGTGGSISGSISGSITVFAAASLKESFTAIGKAFEAANPGTKVTFSFGASSTLAQQIIQGAPADVFASAAAKNMQQVVDAKVAGTFSDFAKNVLEIAVPPDNPGKVAALADLARPGVKVALCQPQVPCGALAQKVLGNAKVTVTPVTLEQDVKSTLTKVQLGEADAALVYVTDVNSARGKVTGIEIPADVNAATIYPIADLSASKNPTLAKTFVAFVLSAPGTAELTKVGFRTP